MTKNWDWTVNKNNTGRYSVETAMLAVLMDIRGELQEINRCLRCPNVTTALSDIHSMGVVARRKRKPNGKAALT
jgi:predicted transcriptional regulator